MAYNNGFPISYQQFYQPQYQTPYGGFQGGNNQMQQQAQTAPQMMTPPTIHAEIVQIADRNEALNFPVGAGQAQMMITRDDSTIFVKSAFAKAIKGRDPSEVWPVIDELMTTIQVIHPRLYTGVMAKL